MADIIAETAGIMGRIHEMLIGEGCCTLNHESAHERWRQTGGNKVILGL